MVFAVSCLDKSPVSTLHVANDQAHSPPPPPSQFLWVHFRIWSVLAYLFPLRREVGPKYSNCQVGRLLKIVGCILTQEEEWEPAEWCPRPRPGFPAPNCLSNYCVHKTAPFSMIPWNQIVTKTSLSAYRKKMKRPPAVQRNVWEGIANMKQLKWVTNLN
jgi:hypothetical protein